MSGTRFGAPVRLSELDLSVKLQVSRNGDDEIQVEATTEPQMNDTTGWTKWAKAIAEETGVNFANGTYEFAYSERGLEIQDMPMEVGEDGRRILRDVVDHTLGREFHDLVTALLRFPTEGQMREALTDALHGAIKCTLANTLHGDTEMPEGPLVTVVSTSDPREFFQVDEELGIGMALIAEMGSGQLTVRHNDDCTHTVLVATPGAGLYSDWLASEMATQVQTLTDELLPDVQQELTGELEEATGRLDNLLERVRSLFGG